MEKKFNIMEDGRHIDLLVVNHAGCLKIKGCDESINYGVVKIENDTLFYFTRQAMIFMSKYSSTKFSEETLIECGYIKTIPLSEIEIVNF